MADDIYEGFGSIGGAFRSELSSAVSPESVSSFRSNASNSRTFVRPALSRAFARNTASARPPSSLCSTRQPLTADPGVSSARGTYHYGEVTREEDQGSDAPQAVLESVLVDSIYLGAEGKIDEALEKSKEAARLCNRLQHQAANFRHGEDSDLSLSSLILKVTLHYGQTLALAGKFRQAEKVFLNLLRQTTQHEGDLTTVNISLATLYQENGDFDKALQIWLTLFDDNVFSSGSEWNFLISQLTTCYSALGRYDLAFKYNEIVAEANDNHEASFRRLLFLVKTEATWEKIQDAYHKLLYIHCSQCSPPSALHSSCTDLTKNATQLMLALGVSPEWTEDELKRSSWQSVATEMDLQHCFDLLENGDVQQLGLFEQSLEHANKAHDAVPEDPGGKYLVPSLDVCRLYLALHVGRLNLGCAHFAMGNHDAALQCFSSLGCEDADLNNKRLLYKGSLPTTTKHETNVTRTASHRQSLQGDTTSALHTLLSVRVDGEDSVALYSRIGWLAASLGDDDTAAWHYNRAHSLDPTDLTVIEWLARYSVEKDMPEKALKFYAEAFRIE
ncbi:hypothetical protein RvY_00380 [Ramazzottius varieornatus]|uniref:Uncharacterized protein n=1 Tax=Ramazzottius varieornatus TaxID=947166 RepID=A0A1D1UG84_RAMVA|nr:hypothetical protein RvY_00380 [Ramazzottius varieornatus]